MQSEQILNDINNYFERQRKVSPSPSNRASQIGSPCLRQLVYYRTAWDQQALPPLGLMKVFAEGNIQEQAVIRLLQDAGYTIIEAQRSISDNLLKKYNISGHLDFFIGKQGEKAILCEAKSMSPYVWQGIDTIEDFKKHTWTLKYYSQIQLYIFGAGEEQGLFLLKNKSTGEIKILEVVLDLDHVEGLLAKSKAIEDHVKAATLPDRISGGECENCPFSHVCLPDQINTAALIQDDPDFIAKLERREALAPAKKEYEEVDKEIKTAGQAVPEAQILAGDWIITKKTSLRKAYTVAEGESVRVDIKRLKGN